MKAVFLLTEGKATVRLALPLLLAHLLQSSMGLVDTIMAGRYSAVALAGVGVGSSLFFPSFVFLLGLMVAVTPLVAQAHGAGLLSQVRGIVRQGMVLGILVGILLMLLLRQSAFVLDWMGVTPDVAEVAEAYLKAVSWSMPIVGCFYALRGGSDGLARPRLSMIAGAFGLACNIVSNYLLIYGHFGLPELGGVGCGYATTLSFFVMVLVLYRLQTRGKLPAALKNSKIHRASPQTLHHNDAIRAQSGLGQLFGLGLPIGLALFVECSIFSLIALFIARLGAEIVAAHQVALNISSYLYMLPYSLASALTIRVGFHLGGHRIAAFRQAVISGLVLATISALATAAFIFIFAPAIAALYSEDTRVTTLAVSLLFFAAIYQLPDSIQTNCAGILRGCKDTRAAMFIVTLSYWGLGLPLGWLLGIREFGNIAPGPAGFWISLICGLTLAALLLLLRVRQVMRSLAATADAGCQMSRGTISAVL
ncbi:MAG: MATE family efflux transporter [Desulfobulbaceae bacterium]|nr:MATE family efflux transporter [Desulfobulbaceae bacterium]